MTGAGRHVVLVGLMATGKSTVGRLLAHRLGRGFVDSDDQIEASEGRTVRDIWRADGEAAFRALEKTALAEALDHDEPLVIAAAGGVVLDVENRARLSDGRSLVVWLRADPALLATRTRTDDHRPLLDDDPVGRLAQMAAERAELYAEVADVAIDIDGHDPSVVADLVEAAQ